MFFQPVFAQQRPSTTSSLRQIIPSPVVYSNYPTVGYQSTPSHMTTNTLRQSFSSTMPIYQSAVHAQPQIPKFEIPHDTMLIYTDTASVLADLEDRTRRDLRHLDEQIDSTTKAIFENLDHIRKSAASTILHRKEQLKEQIQGVAAKIRNFLEDSKVAQAANKASLYQISGIENAKTQIDRAMSAEPHIFLHSGNLEQLLNRMETQVLNLVSPYLANSSLLCAALPSSAFVHHQSLPGAQIAPRLSMQVVPAPQLPPSGTRAEIKPSQQRPVKGILKKHSARNSAHSHSASLYASV